MPPVATLPEIIEQLRVNWMDDFDYGEHRDWSGQSTISYQLWSAPFTAFLPPEYLGIVPMTPFQAANVRLAFELWDDLVAVDLTERTSGNPDISFAHSSMTNGGGSYADMEEELFGTHLTDAAVWINALPPGADADPSDPDVDPPNPDALLFFGGVNFNTYLHEIGHALGLSHPGRYNSGDADPDTYRSDAVYAQDTGQYTVMSYFNAGADGSGTNHVASDGWMRFGAAPLLHDIAAIQAIYGVDTTTRTGNTVYGFNSNAGRMIDGFRLNPYDFAQNPNPIFAIWDAGGTDTIDASGFMTNQTIRLGQGEFSSIGPLTNNIAIAFGATIENAIGGSGNDTIRGNEVNNRLDGGGGDDNLFAGTGIDTLVGGMGRDTLWGAGNDILEGGTDNDLYYVTVGDRVSEAPSGGFRDTVETELTAYFLPENVEILVFTNAEFNPTGAHHGRGQASNNEITGAGGDDTLYGFGGRDILWGGDGGDILLGGGDDDFLYGGGGVDTLVGEYGTDELYGGPDGDGLYGDAGIDYLFGETGTDALVGGDDNDTLDGGPDNDTLHGGRGRDTMTGGSGADTFYYWSVAESSLQQGAKIVFDYVDTITDFQPGVDTIDLSFIDANGSRSGNQAFTFLTTSSPPRGDWSGMLWTTGGTSVSVGGGLPGDPRFTMTPTTVYASTDADADPEFQIMFRGSPTLTAGDFDL